MCDGHECPSCEVVDWQPCQHVVNDRTLFLTISQSGETLDTMAALEMAAIGFFDKIHYCKADRSECACFQLPPRLRLNVEKQEYTTVNKQLCRFRNTNFRVKSLVRFSKAAILSWLVFCALVSVMCLSFATTCDAQFDSFTIALKKPLDGIYRVDRWGIGRIGGYRVNPDEKVKLVEFEGKRIRLDGVRTTGGTGFGPGTTLAAFEIATLVETKPYFEVQVECVPSQPRPGQRFQLVGRMINNGKTSLFVNQEYGRFYVRSNSDLELKNFARAGFLFTDDSVIWGGERVFEWQFDYGAPLTNYQFEAYPSLHNLVEKIEVRPGQSVSMVYVMDAGFPEGDYEFEISNFHANSAGDRSKRYYADTAFTKINVADGPREPIENSGLRASLVSGGQVDEGFRIAANIKAFKPHSNQASNWKLLADKETESHFVWQLQAFDQHDQEIRLRLDRTDQISNLTGRLVQAPESGIDVQLNFAKQDLFDARKIARLSLNLLTDKGLERVEIPWSELGAWDFGDGVTIGDDNW